MLSETEGEFLTLHEFVKAAKARLSPNIWDYLVGATETETTMLRNRMALDNIRERLALFFDAEARIETSATSERYRVEIEMPYRPERA